MVDLALSRSMGQTLYPRKGGFGWAKAEQTVLILGKLAAFVVFFDQWRARTVPANRAAAGIDPGQWSAR